MKYEEVFDRMIQMERASAKYPNLMQTYEVMWKSLKEEIQFDKINSKKTQEMDLSANKDFTTNSVSLGEIEKRTTKSRKTLPTHRGNLKHLWWIIPLLLIIGGITSLKLLSGLLDYTFMNLAELSAKQLLEYKNKTYMVCGYSASCPSDHLERWIGGQCIECRPNNAEFDYKSINFSEICGCRNG